jgi:hypothetical protein
MKFFWRVARYMMRQNQNHHHNIHSETVASCSHLLTALIEKTYFHLLLFLQLQHSQSPKVFSDGID